MGTALKPVAPISGLIFFLVKRFTNFTNKIPPEIDKANAKKPPITIPIVVQFKNASVVIVAPTDNPKKIVAAFMILFEAASNKREVSLPISLIKLPNINIPIKGTALGTNRATTVVTTIINKSKPQELKNKVIIIDASKEYKEGKNQNTLNPESIEKTVKAYESMQDIEKFMRIVPLEEIKENDYNLNIARYIDTSSEEVIINIENVINKIADIEEKEKEIDSKLNEYLKTLGFVS